mmetsp:Transcript_29375/g.56391  ORF Transcript_29375/g.56391 Transcript_29375/m.56391 type:complete len:206 (+) Transcript_29375:417-1034(+)
MQVSNAGEILVMQGVVRDAVLVDVVEAVLKGPERKWIYLVWCSRLKNLQRGTVRSMVSPTAVDPSIGFRLHDGPLQGLHLGVLVILIRVRHIQVAAVLLVPVCLVLTFKRHVALGLEAVLLLHLIHEGVRLREQMQRVDEHNGDFVEHLLAVQHVQQHHVAGDEGGGEHGIPEERPGARQVTRQLYLHRLQPRRSCFLIQLQHFC